MSRMLDIWVSATLFVAGVALFTVTFGDQFDVPTFGGDVGPAFAPRMFLAAWILLAGAALVMAVKGPAGTISEIRVGQLLRVIGIAVLTGYAMTRVGFVFATVPGFALFCWAFQYRRPVHVAIISIALPLIVWALFTFGFELLLPRSPWLHLM